MLTVGSSFQLSEAFSSSARPTAPKGSQSQQQPVGNVLILDHVNINHEKGRHDWLRSFYFDFLKCSVDPRKEDNLKKGSKTLWANIGAQQLHLPEGTSSAQVLKGKITLAYPNFEGLEQRFQQAQEALQGSQFCMVKQDGSMSVMDPWGNPFCFVVGDHFRDERGSQPRGDESEGLGMCDVTIHVAKGSNMAGIGRFYSQIFGAPILDVNTDSCCLSVGPHQTLTFVAVDQTEVLHHDLREEPQEDDKPIFYSNYGPHVSMYVSDLTSTYKKANDLGVAYVNPRFRRRAYSLQEALDQCTFRCLDIVDPEHVDEGPILQLEHEIRSVVKPDGSKYKSCPFHDIPDSCVVNK